jgi:hypothetical protein
MASINRGLPRSRARLKESFFYDQATCEGYGGVFAPPDECCQPECSSSSTESAEAGTVDVATLGLVPPFHVEGP